MSYKYNIYKISQEGNYNKLLTSLNSKITKKIIEKIDLDETNSGIFSEGYKIDCYGSLLAPKDNPQWSVQFDFLKNNENMKSYQPFMIMIFRCDTPNFSCFIATFGVGHFHINQFCDIGFGLDLAQRGLMESNSLKQIKISNCFKVNNNRNITSSKKNCTPQVSNGNVYDLIKALPSDKYKTLFGTLQLGGSISFSSDKSFHSIKDFFEVFENISKSDIVNHIPIRKYITGEKRKILLDYLDNNFENKDIKIYFESINQVGTQIIMESEAQYVIKSKGCDDKDLADLDLTVIKNYLSTKELKPSQVLIEIQDYSIRTINLINLISAEFEYEGSAYFYQDGHFYYYNDEFINQLNLELDKITINAIPVPLQYKIIKEQLETRVIQEKTKAREDKTKSYREQIFNDEIATQQDYITKDRKQVNSIEICDLVDKSYNEIIHVKMGDTSYLSYVFNQATESMKLLKDPKFKEFINEKVGFYPEKVKKVSIWLFWDIDSLSKFSKVKSMHFKVRLFEFVTVAEELGYKFEICADFSFKK